jgi:hypothetical protein
VYHVARYERMDCPEPAMVIPVDDPPPPPAIFDSIESHERANAAPATDQPSIAKPPVEPDVAPVPADPGSIDGPDIAPGDMKLSPAPNDDPAPEPQPTVPHNTLPKTRSAHDESAPRTNGRTVMASRLSDFIRTR